MFYVYLIKSINSPNQKYIGFSSDLKQRIKDHNNGKSIHTSKFKPWELITYLSFSDERQAKEFEYYLKTHSGQAFANKRLWK
ncbi:MAG: GIY-YIG nuclease family protein [Alphaproteobacteria bacterium]|nr:GIY-YIG nuclease family protein [Alphaproteobacteria bacterium]